MTQGFVGADIASLRRLADQFNRAADELRSAAMTVTQGVEAQFWVGPIAMRFKVTWTQEHALRLNSAIQGLRDAAAALLYNADQQDTTSQADGEASVVDAVRMALSNAEKTLKSVFGGSEAAPESDEWAKTKWGWWVDPKWSDKRVELTAFLQATTFMKDVADGGQHLGLYERMDWADLRAMGIDPKILRDASTGFDSEVYRGPEGQIIIAFAATQGMVDWATDAAGVAGVTAQDQRAIQLAMQIRAANPNAELMFVGHSHGGRLAALASIATGAPAITLNTEGLSLPAQLYAANAGGVPLLSQGAHIISGQSLVTSYEVGGDALTSMERGTGIDVPYGRRVGLPDPAHWSEYIPGQGLITGQGGYAPFDNHGIDAARASVGGIIGQV